MVRGNCSVTVGYRITSKQLETALLEAMAEVEGTPKDPKPHI